jgi:hypothetical protein
MWKDDIYIYIYIYIWRMGGRLDCRYVRKGPGAQWTASREVVLHFRVPVTYYVVTHGDLYGQFKQCPKHLYY